jgi:pimeloyl-ACP methyl ester carboxylesterase
MKAKLLLIFCLAGLYDMQAQELARRPFLGIQMLKVDEDTKRVMDLPSTKGVLIKAVIPESTAMFAGFKTGDVLLKINDKEINSPNEGVKAVASYSGGEKFTYELIRDKKVVKGKSVFMAAAMEKHKGIEMHYNSVSTVNGLQRLIVSKPANKEKSPAIIFIGGIGCYSLDTPLDTARPETQLLNKLTRDGFVCVRAEKPGVGDNVKCTPCTEVSFNNEVEGYIAAVEAVKKYSYVDSGRVYIIGHSMGGAMAPVIAKRTTIAGIIAYGTLGSNFIEYLAKTRRAIAEAYNMSPEETDEYIKDYCECAAWYFADKLSTQEAAGKKKDCKEYLEVFDLRSRKYNDELYALNLPAAWKDFSGKALLMWGESDFVASREDHEILAKTVNHYHRNNAEMITMKATSHGMTSADSFQDALKKDGPYNPKVGVVISDWLKKIG